jgi:hypothetical protein
MTWNRERPMPMTTRLLRALGWLLLCLSLVGSASCGDDDDDDNRRSSSNASIISPTPVVFDVVEFRVVGNAVSTTIRYTTSVEGTNQVTTGLPFSVTLRSDRDRIFIALDVAVQIANPTTLNTFVIAQVFVNGQLFREAYGAGILPSVSASGTFVRGQLIRVGD